MNIGPLALALVSLVLIVVGVFITVRDMRAKKPARAQKLVKRQEPGAIMAAEAKSAVIATEPAQTMPPATARFGDANTEVTFVRRGAAPEPQPAAPAILPSRFNTSAFSDLMSAVAAIASEAAADASDAGSDGQRWPSVETRWLSLEPLTEQAVSQLNAALQPIALVIGPPGEPSWGFKNRGFGSYRRLTISGRSVAWLRGELNQENVLTFKVRAHTVEQALLNTTAQTSATHAGPAQSLDVLSKAVRPAAEYAAWLSPRQRQEAETSQDQWSDLENMTREAFAIAQGALREAHATLAEQARPHWDPATGRHRWTLAVDVASVRAVEISIELVKRGFEIQSQTPANRRPDLARKRRLDLAGLTAHALAEAIAACAWPSVAEVLERPDGSQARAE